MSAPPPRTPTYTDPLRHPQHASQRVRNLRGWVLLVLTVVLPGSVQSLLGPRRPGRLALSFSLVTWAAIVILVLAVLLRRRTVFTIGTDPVVLTLLTVWLAAYTVSWSVCLLDTARRIRFVGLSPRVRRGVLGGVLASVLVVGGGLSWATVTANSQRQLMGEIFAGGGAVRPSEGRYNIVLLGSDAGKGREGIRPDSISLVSIDASTGRAVVIGLPRNMQNVPFPVDSPLHAHHPDGYTCGDACLLNAVYLLGEQHADEFDTEHAPAGAQAMKDAVSGATGLQVHYYAMIDLQGFESLIDAMGGIRVVSGGRVPISGAVDASTGEYGPVKGWIEAGEQHLDGYHALWFARSREGASDYERMVRQRCVQEAMLSQLDPATVLLRYQALAQAAPEVISTDIPQSQVDSFVQLALEAQRAGMDSLNLTPPAVAPSHPDFAEVHRLVENAIEESTAQEEDAASAQAPGGGLSAAPSGGRAAPAGGSRDLLLASAQGVPSDDSGAVQIRAAAEPEQSDGESQQDSDRAICYVD